MQQLSAAACAVAGAFGSQSGTGSIRSKVAGVVGPGPGSGSGIGADSSADSIEQFNCSVSQSDRRQAAGGEEADGSQARRPDGSCRQGTDAAGGGEDGPGGSSSPQALRALLQAAGRRVCGVIGGTSSSRRTARAGGVADRASVVCLSVHA